MAYTRVLRRTREEKTNYRRRGAMLMSRRSFVTVFVSNENVQVQILEPGPAGDAVVASAHSRSLAAAGWKGSRKCVPASYLTGYMAGRRAAAKGARGAVVYSGTRRYTQRMAAAVRGVIDAGVDVPAGEGSLPPDERIRGDHLRVKGDVAAVKSAIDGGAA